MSQALVLPTNGLMTDPGPFSVAPEGGLCEAENVIMMRPGVIEPRPGMTWFTDQAARTGGFRARQCYSDPNDVVWTWSLDQATSTTWLIRRNATSTITGPTSFTRGKIRIIPTGGRALFTSNNGMCTLPSQAASPGSGSATMAYRSGLPQPDLPIVSIGAGSIPASRYIRYRFTLRRRLANGTLIESAPTSGITVATGAGGGIQFHGWTSAAPYQAYRTPVWVAGGFGELITGDELCVYRSLTVSNFNDASDELRLRAVIPFNTTFNAFVDPQTPSSANPWTDKVPDGQWYGEPLYTNETEGGPAAANYRPDYARDGALYRGMTFYAGATSVQRVSLRLNAMGVSSGVTDINSETALCAPTTDTSVSVTTGSPTISNITGVFVGQVVQTTGTNPDVVGAFPANTYITAVSGTTATASANSLVTNAALSLTMWDWVEVEASSLRQRMYVTNVSAGAAVLLPDSASVASCGAYGGGNLNSGPYGAEQQWNNHRTAVGATDWERWRRVQLHCVGGDYDTTSASTLRSQWTFETTDPSDAAFVVRSSKPLAWDRHVDSITGVTSKPEGGIAELRWSKTNEPECWPLANRTTVGDAASAIRRVVAVENSLFIFKDDGLFQAFGETPDSLTFRLVDRTVTIPTPLSATIDEQSKWVERFDDRVYAMTTRGPMAISDSGTQLVGQPILETLRRQFVAAFGAADDVGRGMCVDYQSRRVWFMSEAQSSGYVLDVDTGTWSIWSFSVPISAACVRSTIAIPGVYGGVVVAGIWYAGFPQTSRTMLTPVQETFGLYLSTMPQTYDSWIGETVTVSSVTGTGPYLVILATGGEAWVPYEGDILIDSANVPHNVVSTGDSSTVFETETAPALGVATWRVGYACRAVWVARTERNPASEKHWRSMALPMELGALTNRMRSYFRGYRNTGAALEEFVDETQAIGPQPWSLAPRYKRVSVPTAMGRDWALRMGFSIRQAGVWFSANPLSVLYEPIAADKAAR